MNRDYLLRAFERERAEKRRHARRQRFPQWLSYAPTRPVGRRERAAADDPWTDVAVCAWSIAFLLLVYRLAEAMPR